MRSTASQIAGIVRDALLAGDVRAAIEIAKEHERVTLDGPPRGLLMIGHERPGAVEEYLYNERYVDGFLRAIFAEKERDIGVLCHALLRQTTLEEFERRFASPIEMAFERRGTIRWISLYDARGVLLCRQRVEPDVVMDAGVTASIQRSTT